jgi:hypothetical protein
MLPRAARPGLAAPRHPPPATRGCYVCPPVGDLRRARAVRLAARAGRAAGCVTSIPLPGTELTHLGGGFAGGVQLAVAG